MPRPRIVSRRVDPADRSGMGVHPGRDMTKMVERAMMSSFIRDRLLRRPGGELTRKSEGGRIRAGGYGHGAGRWGLRERE